MTSYYVVAGASGAIGRSLCHQIVQRGGTPLLVGRSTDRLQELRDELGTGDVLGGIDFSNESVGDALKDELSGVSIRGLAYAVGDIMLKPLKGSRTADFRQSYQLHVLGAVELIQASLKGLKAGSSPEDPSSVVLFSSIAAARGLPNHSIIGASKGAIEGLTRSLAAELAPSVRVNCVAPSLTQGSAMAAKMTSNEKMAQAIAQAHPLPRLGRPEDSANAAAFLLTDAGWTTGTVLSVDGGRSTVLK